MARARLPRSLASERAFYSIERPSDCRRSGRCAPCRENQVSRQALPLARRLQPSCDCIDGFEQWEQGGFITSSPLPEQANLLAMQLLERNPPQFDRLPEPGPSGMESITEHFVERFPRFGEFRQD
jgi:hypothetical protein